MELSVLMLTADVGSGQVGYRCIQRRLACQRTLAGRRHLHSPQGSAAYCTMLVCLSVCGYLIIGAIYANLS